MGIPRSTRDDNIYEKIELRRPAQSLIQFTRPSCHSECALRSSQRRIPHENVITPNRVYRYTQLTQIASTPLGFRKDTIREPKLPAPTMQSRAFPGVSPQQGQSLGCPALITRLRLPLSVPGRGWMHYLIQVYGFRLAPTCD